MNIIDTALLWVLARRGYTYPSELPPDTQLALRRAREAAEEFAATTREIDAMAAAMGVTPIDRNKERDRA